MIKPAKVLLLCLFCVIIPLGLSLGEVSRQCPLLGTDMITDIQVIEDHKDALAHWQSIGVKDALLVNIDAHDDMRAFPIDQLAGLKSESMDLDGTEHDVGRDTEQSPALLNSNFIHAAAKLGIVRKVVWIAPDTFNLFSDSGQNFTSLLRKSGFSRDDISTFRRENSCFSGFSDRVPLMVCDIDTLPDLDEPILLTIDLDYFPAMLKAKKPEITLAIKKTFTALCSKGYKIRDTTIAYSVNGGFLDCCYRWIADLIVDTLRIPGMYSQIKLPCRYEYLQSLDLLARFKRYKELLHEIAVFQSKGGTDPDVFLYAAKAYHGVGQTENAFAYAENACLNDRDYCYGLAEIGTALLDVSDIATAERFFSRGYELRPKMDLGQFRLAMALKKSGHLDEAISYFKIFRNSYGPFPIDFYIAEAFLLKKDNTSARQYYDSGRDELLRNPLDAERFGDYSVIEKGAAFYEQHGLTQHATLLREKIGRQPM